jgi:hypothetical protein
VAWRCRINQTIHRQGSEVAKRITQNVPRTGNVLADRVVSIKTAWPLLIPPPRPIAPATEPEK